MAGTLASSLRDLHAHIRASLGPVHRHLRLLRRAFPAWPSPWRASTCAPTSTASWFTIAILFGLLGVLASPFQIVGGAVGKHVGRRPTMVIAAISDIVWFVGFAYAHPQPGRSAVLVVIESALGWPLFLTSSNAMITDVLPRGNATPTA